MSSLRPRAMPTLDLLQVHHRLQERKRPHLQASTRLLRQGLLLRKHRRDLPLRRQLHLHLVRVKVQVRWQDLPRDPLAPHQHLLRRNLRVELVLRLRLACQVNHLCRHLVRRGQVSVRSRRGISILSLTKRINVTGQRHSRLWRVSITLINVIFSQSCRCHTTTLYLCILSNSRNLSEDAAMLLM